MQMKALLKAGLVCLIAAWFIGASATPITGPLNATFTKTKATRGFQESSHDQIELHYYDPNTLTGYGGSAEPPFIWKTAIRLTQSELASYNTWNLTQVVIGFGEDPNEGPMDVRIYIYDKGDATRPGNIIANDTTATLNGTQLIMVPLATPVSLIDHNEIWVAVEWIQDIVMSHYVFVDAGPAVKGKGDWIYFRHQWEEIYDSVDGNWALGAVVEGQGLATLGIGTIKGPLGITTELQNTGDVDASNITWSITIKGGFLDLVNKTANGTMPILAAHLSSPISVPPFIGFGKIRIEIIAYAKNAANEIFVTKSAFLVGPFVIRIK
jgi:hypothetical protein